MQNDPHPPGPGKEGRRRTRQDRLAASLRENLLRRKAQARTRKAGAAVDLRLSARPADAEVDLEATGVLSDTGAGAEDDREGAARGHAERARSEGDSVK